MLQANLFQEQGSEEKLPEPVIVYVSDEEKKAMAEKAEEFFDDDEKYLQVLALYPLAANILQRLKKENGMEFLLRKKYNLYNAVQRYGKEWLKI